MFDLIPLIKLTGYLGVGFVVFAESGLFIGIFLPGDSLLFTAGLLASQGYLHILPLIAVSFCAAVAGDTVGYWFGRTFGPAIFKRKGSVLLDPKHITRAEHFFHTYGARTIVLARFMPFVRTLTPVLAGVGSMPYGTFLLYNIIGGALWGVGLPLAGYWLGATVPNVDHYLLPIIVLIVCVSVLPGAWQFLRDTDNRNLLMRRIRALFT